ncbi:MAG: 4-(cytidine 5'-diphospho)-2-C-methyl-D-erythritol kinase [Gammaproteobacteria bacterium]|nr:MAG: 4-(cytidine 5'-diphospho)-2-C-methyl-D-erythritol kinase [Gammaproteobacteria bacterium]PIE37200.1 MAG: 4-(cytidine 5'-diphospho)-2-C-methyl-D-erythritol kinase [Gammaproteobacteria bacterium]
MTTNWLAPAKINLFLHITGRRSDGYHTLQTVYQFVNLCDVLQFSVREDKEIHLHSDFDEVPPESNLVVRAARALQNHSGTRAGTDITLKKVIPTGGGLGGGSSDAATTLVALNEFWRLGLSIKELAEIGVTVSADVPVFVYGQASWAEGIGDKLTPVVPIEPWYLIVDPGVHISTATIFNAPELTRNLSPITIRDFMDGRSMNVFEPIVRTRYPEVRDALDWLRVNYRKSRAKMSGTGSCVFAAFATEAEARDLAAKLPEGMTGYVVKGRNSSPLYDFAG